MLHKFGVSSKWAFTDCYSLDEEMLCMIPRPCLAFILLFPSREEKEKQASNQTDNSNVFFMRQLVNNACGTIAIVHSVLNNIEKLGLGMSFKAFSIQVLIDNQRMTLLSSSFTETLKA